MSAPNKTHAYSVEKGVELWIFSIVSLIFSLSSLFCVCGRDEVLFANVFMFVYMSIDSVNILATQNYKISLR